MILTILHVEDDPGIAKLVALAFKRFGFSGVFLAARSITDAVELLDERALAEAPVDLIIVDIELPDGTGLDIVRKVRRESFWHLTPVLVLSGETEPDTVNYAYALGANCYLPKVDKPIIQSLHALYDCWVGTALLPARGEGDPAKQLVDRATVLRARTSDLYLRLAEIAESGSGEARFWLERSITAGNLSNLIAVFRDRIGENGLPAGAIEQITTMHAKAEQALAVTELYLQTGTVTTEEIFMRVLDVVETIDDEIVAKYAGSLSRENPVATIALVERGVAQHRELAEFILSRTGDLDLRRRAERLRERAERIEASFAARLKNGWLD